MIVCENLVKIYKTTDLEVVALQGLDLSVEDGELMAIIGNSGSGKSTLLNMLGGLDRPSAGTLMVDDKDLLKATDKQLVKYKRDTVGFVSKLPTKLVEAFKGTLEEVKHADLLIHVVDASNKNLDIQIKTTLKLLKELEVMDKPILTVFNKMDKAESAEKGYDLRDIGESMDISAKLGTNLEQLRTKIQEMLPQMYRDATLLIPYSNQSLVSYFMNEYEITELEYLEEGTRIKLVIDQIDFDRYKEYII